MQSFDDMRKLGYLAAVPCGKQKRVPVRVQCNGETQNQLLANYGSEPSGWLIVIAPSAAAAANWVRDAFNWPANTEIVAIGPKGGEVSRFIGFESMIAREIMRPVTARQYDLFG